MLRRCDAKAGQLGWFVGTQWTATARCVEDLLFMLTIVIMGEHVLFGYMFCIPHDYCFCIGIG